ncbi:hypothetical protein GQ457_09G027850 [Hibiscus cannabinus]
MLPNGDSVEGHHPGLSRKASESSFCPTEDEDDDKDDESLRRWKNNFLGLWTSILLSAHRSRHSGASAKRKAKDKNKNQNSDQKQQNPKAFAFRSNAKAKRLQSRAVEKEQRRLHLPVMDRSYGELPPFVVVVQGPPQVGKSLLIKTLVKHYTKHNLPEVRGPITIVSGKQRRLQFVECPNDINGMIDAAKFADLALLLIDGSYGFEMKTFEFLNILQIHGFPKVMGILTHLDKYPKREIHNLARFISVMKFPPLSWRTSLPYILIDRLEDVTPPERVQMNNKCDRNVTLYDYFRGCNLKKGTKIQNPFNQGISYIPILPLKLVSKHSEAPAWILDAMALCVSKLAPLMTFSEMEV